MLFSMVIAVLVVPLVLVGSYASPWFLWFSWFLLFSVVLVVLVVPLVLRDSRGSLVLLVLLVLLVGYPVVLAARSPSIGTTCGNLDVRHGMRVESERMLRDERDTELKM